MIQRCLTVNAWLLFAVIAFAQAPPPVNLSAEVLPKPTPEGIADLQRLVARCVNGGALQFLPRTKAGPSRLVLVSREVLGRILREDPAAITPALRDTLVTTSQRFDQSVLLEAVAQLDNDAKLLAYAALARALSLEREGNAPDASRRYAEADRRFGELGFVGRKSEVLSSWAALLESQAQFAPARDRYQQALALVEKIHGRANQNTAIAHINLGGVEKSLGSMELALSHYRQASEILAALNDVDAMSLVSVHQQIGSLLMDRGDSKGALAELQQSLEWAGKLPEGERRTTGQARTLSNLAMIEQRSRRRNEALVHYRRSIDLLEGLAAGKPHAMLAEVLD